MRLISLILQACQIVSGKLLVKSKEKHASCSEKTASFPQFWGDMRFSLMWKLVIILENPFQSKGILASRRFDGNFLVHRRSPPKKQKQRQGGRVCCANLVIVWQIYDLQLHRTVIAFLLLHIIYWHPLPI